MDRQELRAWVDARRRAAEIERRSSGAAPDSQWSWEASMSLLGLLGQQVGWPVPPDAIRRRDDAEAVDVWRRLRAAYGRR